ncbi:MAG TPA: 2-phosphosulfolactate phosphatase [Candidatus Sulfotelmatobacter sp.]|nr:2-phosphosulfolactate phosphatase [Candidatus Sulfotelmatobacter sp.]
MQIETILSPAELPLVARRDLRETACVVFDILRATSTFVTALQNGAEKIIPVGEICEAVALKNKFPGLLLAGERDGVKICAVQSGGIDFDLGNSPREFTPEKIRGQTIVSTTTNGTRALRACAKAKTVLAASFLNLAATAKFLEQQNFNKIMLICAGTGDGVADEDVLAAGAMVDLLAGRDEQNAALNHPACGIAPGIRARTAQRAIPTTISTSSEFARRSFQSIASDLYLAMTKATNGTRLQSNPDLRGDVVFCAQRDIYDLVVVMDAEGALRVVASSN